MCIRDSAYSRGPGARGQNPRGHRGDTEPSSGAGQARRLEDDGGLRTPGQRVDRSRKTASARPLCDLIVADDGGLRHCEEQSDEAIHVSASGAMDCFASLAMTCGESGCDKTTRRAN